MIRRLLAVWRHRDDVVAGRARYPGYLLPHLLAAAREPKEPPRADARAHDDVPAPTVLLPALRDAGTGAGAAVVVRDTADRQPTAAPSTSDRPQVTMGEHEGATEEFATVLAGMRHDLEHDGGSLDPAEREQERIEREWEEAFARVEGLLDLEARRGERRLRQRLDAFAPGWEAGICHRQRCPLCVEDFDEAMRAAGVIALPAEPVDWATGEWPVLEVAG